MNKLLLKAIFPIFGVLLGPLLLIATFRSFIGMALGSGIYGAVPLALFVAVFGTIVAILITFNSVKALLKLFVKENQS